MTITGREHTGRWIGVLGLAVVLTAAGSLNGFAGELEPPVPPGTPTMKTMDELEPRRPIYAEMLPLRIVEKGTSWYLAESILTAGAGITVAADNVTIDLMGFALEGGTGVGIKEDAALVPAPEGVTVRNGTVTGWPNQGIRLGARSTVVEVRATSNGGTGIEVGRGSLVADCVASGNDVHGIATGFIAVVRDCVVEGNSQNGIYAVDSTLIVNCSVNNNDRNGIRVDDSCYVLDNRLHANSLLPGNDYAGIWVTGMYNRIEGNHVSFNRYGLRIDGGNNVAVRNSAQANITQNYDLYQGNNMIGTIRTTSLTSAGPWDNLCIGNCP